MTDLTLTSTFDFEWFEAADRYAEALARLERGESLARDKLLVALQALQAVHAQTYEKLTPPTTPFHTSLWMAFMTQFDRACKSTAFGINNSLAMLRSIQGC